MAQISFRPFSKIESSKSIMNRLLICKSYFPILQIEGQSTAEDVKNLEKALSNLNQKTFFAGSGATTFRFLALRLSRYPGEHKITMTKQLAKRPQKELSHIFEQIGISHKFSGDSLILQGQDWQWNKEIEVDVSQSSQFLSSILLNAWLLPKDLSIFFNGKMVSQSYFQMTLEILHYLGMEWQPLDEGIRISAKQSLSKEKLYSEIDLSSAFVVASLAAVYCEAKIENFIYPSIQGDSDFLQIFEELGVPFMLNNQVLKILPAKNFRSIKWDLSSSPDLFPLLAVLCTLCDGQSKLSGLGHLLYKESNRIDSTLKLLDSIGAKFEYKDNAISIRGNKEYLLKKQTTIDTFDDHRIAFAAALAKLHGHNLFIQKPEVVNKSFPDFWQQFSPNFCSVDLYQ